MIEVSGDSINLDTFINQYSLNNSAKNLLQILSNSPKLYDFSSQQELKFEIDMRLNTIKAAKDLARSGMDFEVFRESECNEEYWDRTEEGGFRLKEGIKPSEAMRDIFSNGKKYGTECATAMVIVFYKAVLDTYPEALFNKLFSNIILMNWHYIDSDLDIRNYRDVNNYLPGDCLYFKNPDVDPTTPEWQGENAIYLGDDKYYGHGMGITSAENIIKYLNKNRIDDSTTPAYLMDQSTRPNYKYLYHRYNTSDQNYRIGFRYHGNYKALLI